MTDKERLRKELNEFLDSASEDTIREFLQFIKERREKRSLNKFDSKNQLN